MPVASAKATKAPSVAEIPTSARRPRSGSMRESASMARCFRPRVAKLAPRKAAQIVPCMSTSLASGITARISSSVTKPATSESGIATAMPRWNAVDASSSRFMSRTASTCASVRDGGFESPGASPFVRVCGPGPESFSPSARAHRTAATRERTVEFWSTREVDSETAAKSISPTVTTLSALSARSIPRSRRSRGLRNGAGLAVGAAPAIEVHPLQCRWSARPRGAPP